MRVTFILPFAGLSGGARVVAIHAQQLLRRGHDVTVVSLPARPVPFRAKVKSFLVGDGWPDAASQASHLDGTGVLHHVLESWRPVEDRDLPDADVVVATWWMTAEWVAALSPTKGAKVYLVQDGVFSGDTGQRVLATWRLPLYKIVISRWLVAAARKLSGAREVAHVPNSVDLEQFSAPPRDKQSCPTVGLLYSRGPVKGCDVSFRAIAIARQRVPQLHLIAFGAEKPARTLPLPSNARFWYRPAQDELRNIYRQCDVWLCGARCEGFHLPALEAMACRCPVVSTRCGGPEDIVQDGVNGYLVPVEDSEALADRLTRVVRFDDVNWRRMSAAAYATAVRYTWDDAADLFEAALFRAVKHSQRGQPVGQPIATNG